MRTWLICFLIFGMNACSFDEELELVNPSKSIVTFLNIGQYLYEVNSTTVSTFDTSVPKTPKLIDKLDVGYTIESMSQYDGYLILGSKDDMVLCEIGENGIPKIKNRNDYSSAFQDIVCSFDPMLIRDDIAYISISNSIYECALNRYVNILKTYDVSDINHPKLLNSYNMSNPKGMAFGKKSLFVSDNKDGLLVFDISNPSDPNLITQLDNVPSYDVIVKGNLLISVTQNALIQYDITDEGNMTYLSTIYL